MQRCKLHKANHLRVLIYWIRNWRLPFSMIQRRSTLVQQIVKSGAAGNSGSTTTFVDKSKNKKVEGDHHRSTNNALVNLEAQLADITADNTPLYERDNLLTPVTQQFLFNEYLEMGGFLSGSNQLTPQTTLHSYNFEIDFILKNPSMVFFRKLNFRSGQFF